MQEQTTNGAGARKTVRRVAALFRPYRGRVAILTALILASSGIGVVNPLLTKTVFDKALFPHGGGQSPKLGLPGVLVGVMIGIAVVGGALGVAQTFHAAGVRQRVMQDPRDRLYPHLQAMSLRFFTSTR